MRPTLSAGSLKPLGASTTKRPSYLACSLCTQRLSQPEPKDSCHAVAWAARAKISTHTAALMIGTRRDRLAPTAELDTEAPGAW